MTTGGVPKFLVIDNFLPDTFVRDLLEYALKNRGSFVPASVMSHGVSQVAAEKRISEQCELGLGPLKPAFTRAIHDRQDEFVADLGIQPFTLTRTETQLIAHGDQAFYKAHIDTHTSASRTNELDSDRVLSAVYYFHREPKGFTGGEIALHPFIKGTEPVPIEPRQNRLVVFPSFAWHEVRRISCPSGDFADSRFAINCWLHRDRHLSARSEASRSSTEETVQSRA